MNILLDDLPKKINDVPINCDFRAMLLFELMISDPKVSDDTKVQLAISYLYLQPVSDLQQAIDGLLWFYRCGVPKDKNANGKKSNDRAYDFEQDASLIYAAFRQTYGIDLNETYLHWWKFSALFMALPEDCMLSKIMGYRTMDLSQYKGKEKQYYTKLKRQYRLKPLGIETLSIAASDQVAKDRVAARFAEAEAWAKNHR